MALISLRKNLRTGLAALLLGISSGCAELKYYSNLVEGHAEILFNKQSIEEVLEDSQVDEETKQKLRLVQDVRKYAIEKLHLPDTGAYTDYVDLDKIVNTEQNAKEEQKAEETAKEEQEYIAVFITACRSLKFEVKEWWYPFVGTQRMRTFYDKEEAEAYAEELEHEGWDIEISETYAYSTGKFLNNPLLGESLGDLVTNVMLAQNDAHLIEYLFHEMAHQLVYIDEDTTFNESFAEFVGEEGARQYLEDHQQKDIQQKDHQQKFPETLTEKQMKRMDDDLFYEIITAYRGWLDLLYNSPLPDEEKFQKKKKIFQAMKDTYLREAQPLGAGKEWWFAQKLNNAHLITVQEYFDYVDEFAALFEHAAYRNWEEFYDIVQNISEWPDTKRKEFLRNFYK